MFDSPLFDTAIALVTLYLLFSQLTLSLVELPAGFLNTRGKYLYDRLKDALGADIHSRFYAASTIKSISSPKKEKIISLFGEASLHPAYISENLFAQTIIACVGGETPDDSQTPIAQFKAGLDKLPVVATNPAKSTDQALTNPPPTAPDPNATFAGTLRTLYANAISVGNDSEEQSAALLRNLESWFHDFGERLTGRYKRDNRKYLFLGGFLVAILADVDTVRLARFLADSNNAKARLAVVAAGVAATQEPPPKGLSYNPSDSLEAAQYDAQRQQRWDSLYTSARRDLQTTIAAVPQVGLPLGLLRWTNTDAVRDDTTTVINKATSKRRYTKPASYSWAPTADDYKMPVYAQRWKLNKETGEAKLIGKSSFFLLTPTFWNMFGSWLLTAFALMLGAPFWFDTLCRFVNIRNVGIIM